MKTLVAHISGLKKHYGKRRALDGLDLKIPGGAVVGLVGENGAGKTTTMGIMAGLIRADLGTVNLFDDGPYDPMRHKGRLTLLPQDAHFHPHARVANILVSCAQLQGLSRSEAVTAVHETLEWVNLSDRADSPVRTLSHGMVRRLTVAQAFLGKPELILLDEPTSGLDPLQVVQVRDLVRKRHDNQAILVSSHILTEIEAVCDEVAFVKDGRTTKQESLTSITRQQKLMTYRIERGPDLSLGKIRDLLPDASIELNPEGTLLVVKVTGEALLSPVEINRLIIPVLLETGCGILEVSTGSNLEQEYLNSFDMPHKQ